MIDSATQQGWSSTSSEGTLKETVDEQSADAALPVMVIMVVKHSVVDISRTEYRRGIASHGRQTFSH